MAKRSKPKSQKVAKNIARDNNNKRFRQWCGGGADSAREPASVGIVFMAEFGFNIILLLLLLTNWILGSLSKMIKDREMKEILDEMSVVFTMMRMRKKKKKERTGRSMEEND